MKKIYNIALIALALLVVVGCEQHFWDDDEVIEQTSVISINPSGGTPVYEYAIYPELLTMMEWDTSSSISSYNPIYSYFDNSTEVDGVLYYNLEFVESRYDDKGNETQYFYEIVQTPPAKSTATRASDGSVDMVVTNLTTDTVIATITGAQLSQSMAAATATDFAEQSEESVTYEAVTLDERRVTLSVGEPLTLIATIGDKVATSSDVTWSSDHKEYVTVSSEGVITALAEGKSNITVTAIDGGSKALCTINVVVKMESITITPLNYELAFGEGVEDEFTTFTVTQTAFTPENATISATEWRSSDESIATVSEDGLVTAITAGVVEIYAASTDGSGVESEHCVVTIKAAEPVTKIEISGAPDADMKRGDTAQLTAIVTPDNATNSAVEWSSSAPAIISVTEDGKIEALAAGKATITATAKDGSEIYGATAEITVVIPITYIELSNYSESLEINDVETVTWALTPLDTTDTDVTWDSTNKSIATVDESGKVTALTAGETIISVTSVNNGDIKDSYTLTVKAQTVKVSSVELGADQIIKYSDSVTADISSTVLPANAANSALNWKSSNTAIATVANDGKVTALQAGEVTITATAADGSGCSDECTILFCSASIDATLNAPLDECTGSNTTRVDLTSVYGSTAPTSVSWESSATTIATIDASGLITSLAVGTTTITYKATVGTIQFEETCVVTVAVKSFPDATFRTLLNTKCGVVETDGGIYLTTENQTALNTITTLVNNDTKGVTDATGIAYLTKLNSFVATSNFTPTTLDLSKNEELTVKVEINGLATSSVLNSITLGNLSKLKLLTLKNHTKLTSIDISGCGALTKVVVTGWLGQTRRVDLGLRPPSRY